MKTLRVENKTHWRSSDIERIVRLAMDQGLVEDDEARVVRVFFPKRPTKTKRKKKKTGRRRSGSSNAKPGVVTIKFRSAKPGKTIETADGTKVQTEITLHLPLRGAKESHPVAMVALAAARAVSSEVDEDAILLPFSNVYFIANYLAQRFASEAGVIYEDDDKAFLTRRDSLLSLARSGTPPDWGDPGKLYIAKEEDPLKDATFQDFLKKKQRAIRTDKTKIKNLEKDIENSQRLLKVASKRLKAAEKSIEAATTRRLEGV